MTDLLKKIYKRQIVLSFFILIGLSFTDQAKLYILSYLFGALISSSVLYLHSISVVKSVMMEAGKAELYGKRQYFFRMMIYVFVMGISIYVDYLDFLLVILGIMSVKIVIYLSTIFDKDFL